MGVFYPSSSSLLSPSKKSFISSVALSINSDISEDNPSPLTPVSKEPNPDKGFSLRASISSLTSSFISSKFSFTCSASLEPKTAPAPPKANRAK